LRCCRRCRRVKWLGMLDERAKARCAALGKEFNGPWFSLARVWQANADVAECEMCHEHFTMLKRKHHCRNCGKVGAVVCVQRVTFLGM